MGSYVHFVEKMWWLKKPNFQIDSTVFSGKGKAWT